MKEQRPYYLFSLLLVSISAVPLLHHPPLPAAAAAPDLHNSNLDANSDFILSSCRQTLYPDLCYTSLSRYANAVQQDPALLARLAIGVSLSKSRRMAGYLSNISRLVDESSAAAGALRDCLSVFGDAVDQIRGSLKQMRKLSYGGESLRFQLSNVQTWMSAALTNEETCTDGLEDVGDCPAKTDVCDRVVKVKEVTSIALALVNSFVSKIPTP